MRRCGKSAPGVLVTSPARQTPPEARPNRNFIMAPFYAEVRVGCMRYAVTYALDEWLLLLREAQNPAYRSSGIFFNFYDSFFVIYTRNKILDFCGAYAIMPLYRHMRTLSVRYLCFGCKASLHCS